MSVSAMLVDALIGFCVVIADRFCYTRILRKSHMLVGFWHAKCQNVKLPMFSVLPQLDKLIAGIPNAIGTRSAALSRRRRTLPALAITMKTERIPARQVMLVTSAQVACVEE
ncbi:MAG TPA: hypothetical protein VKT76_04490 [Bradyrhizobium sp.]|nr:hypothetical protein [Bradyrhizobium sp.]